MLDVSKTSDKKAYPKGRISLPKSSVLTIRLTQTKSAKGRIIGTLAGIWGGGGIAAAIAVSQPDDGSGSAIANFGALALWVGAGVGGYYVGKSFDRKTRLVKVLPD